MPFSLTENQQVNYEVDNVEIIDFTVDLVRQEIHYTYVAKNPEGQELYELTNTITSDHFVAVLTSVENYDVDHTVYESIKRALYDDYNRQSGRAGTVI